MNQERISLYSSCPGVTWHSRNRQWQARIRVGGGKEIYLGIRRDVKDAIALRKEAEKKAKAQREYDAKNPKPYTIEAKRSNDLRDREVSLKEKQYASSQEQSKKSVRPKRKVGSSKKVWGTRTVNPHVVGTRRLN